MRSAGVPIRILTVLAAAAALNLSGQTLPVVGPGDVNVADHGVRGDGRTDVTAALQQVADSLENHPGMFVQRNWGGGSSLGSHPRVVFPAGEYLISATIIWPKWVTIVGLGEVTIRQLDATKDVFYFHWGWRVRLFNLQFVGGKRQVKIWGNDTDGLILIAGCRFTKSAEWAIENLMFERGAENESAGGYVRDESGRLADIGNPDKPLFFNSTMMNIVGCEFTDCGGVVSCNTDWTTLDRVVVRAGPGMGAAAVQNFCMMQIRNSLFEFSGGDAGSRSWVEQWRGQLTLSDVTTRGDDVGAMPLVTARQRFHIPRPTGTQNSISIDGCEVNLGRSGKVPLVRCVEIPNLVSIAKCVSTSGRAPSVEVVGEDALSDLPETSTVLVKIVFGPGLTNLETKVPAELERFVYHSDASADGNWDWPGIAADGAAVDAEMAWMQIPAPVIAPPAGMADHTDWLQGEIDRAAGGSGPTGMPRLVLAPQVYRLTDALNIPARFRLEVAGMALFKVIEPGASALQISNPEQVSISSIAFEGGTNTASIKETSGSGGEVRFFSCYFWYARGAAIRAKLHGSARDAGEPSSLVVDHCYFGTSYTYVVSDIPTLIASSYVSTRILEPSPDRGYTGAVFWMNAPLVMRNLLMVPVVKTREVDYSWVVTADGRVDMDWIRIGGEYGGISAIKVLAEAPFALLRIQNTWLYTFINHLTRSSVYLAREPDEVVVINNTGGPELAAPDRVFIRIAPTVETLADPVEWFRFRANTFPTEVSRGDEEMELTMEFN